MKSVHKQQEAVRLPLCPDLAGEPQRQFTSAEREQGGHGKRGSKTACKPSLISKAQTRISISYLPHSNQTHFKSGSLLDNNLCLAPRYHSQMPYTHYRINSRELESSSREVK